MLETYKATTRAVTMSKGNNHKKPGRGHADHTQEPGWLCRPTSINNSRLFFIMYYDL